MENKELLIQYDQEVNRLRSIIKELEEENKKLKEIISNLATMTANGDKTQIKNTAQYKLELMQQRIDKAIEYIENIEEDKEVDNLFVNTNEKSFLTFYKIKKDLLKILKGEE